MAAALQLQNDVCQALMGIENQYITSIYQGQKLENLENIIILMATTYLTNKEVVMGCFTTTRTTQTSRNATLLSLIQEFYYEHELGVKRDEKHSRLARMFPTGYLITALEEQYKAVSQIQIESTNDGDRANMDIDDDVEMGGMEETKTGGKRGKKGGKKQRGGFFSPSIKKGFANVILAGLLVGGLAAYKTGALYTISKYLVTYFSPAFIDDSHCVSNLGYIGNALLQYIPGGNAAQSCRAIFDHNNATSDWIVTTTTSLITYFKVSGGFAGLSVLATWGSAQNKIITSIIDPLDSAIDYILAKVTLTRPTDKNLKDFKDIIIKTSAIKKYTELQAQAQLAAGVQPGQGDTHPNAELRQLQQISDNIDDEEERRRAPALYFNQSVDSITLRNVAELTISDRGVGDTHILSDAEKLLYYKTIQEYMRAQADSSSTSGGKKKRKTMKKKRRHKKRVRKSGKKKIHKKKGKKTVKKHHKKHQKKRNKKHARKTRKH